MAGLRSLPNGVLVGLLGCLICAAAGASVGYGFAARYTEARLNARIEQLKAAHAEQARVATDRNQLRLLRDVERANRSVETLLMRQQEQRQLIKQLQERIPHVTTVYRPAPAAAPVAIPHCVFTAGWLRDFNRALGTGLPTTERDVTASGAAQAPWPATGSDAELLESGVTPADILAYAQDYGHWVRNNLAQLNALLDLHKD